MQLSRMCYIYNQGQISKCFENRTSIYKFYLSFDYTCFERRITSKILPLLKSTGVLSLSRWVAKSPALRRARVRASRRPSRPRWCPRLTELASPPGSLRNWGRRSRRPSPPRTRRTERFVWSVQFHLVLLAHTSLDPGCTAEHLFMEKSKVVLLLEGPV